MLKNNFKAGIVEAGCDEAGRGCLAGPVAAAAVILPPDFKDNRLNDSKKLTEKVRYELRSIIESASICFKVAFVDNHEIDKINILKASIIAMHKALDGLEQLPQHIIVDGNRFYPFRKIPHTCIVKGDSEYLSIAAASVLAKTYRDDFMNDLDLKFPQYNWKSNKGYPTKDHREAIVKHGATEYHRKSFKLLEKQMEIKF